MIDISTSHDDESRVASEQALRYRNSFIWPNNSAIDNSIQSEYFHEKIISENEIDNRTSQR